MTRPTKGLVVLTLVASGFLGGCGDPAPSTALAPDKPAPDAGKLTAEQIQAMHDSNNATVRK